MKILFEDVTILFEDGKVRPNMYLLVTDKNITYIGERKPEDGFDRIFNCRGKVLCPGFYNCHTHVPMTLFRGYAENLPLSRWLHEKNLSCGGQTVSGSGTSCLYACHCRNDSKRNRILFRYVFFLRGNCALCRRNRHKSKYISLSVSPVCNRKFVRKR